MHKRRISWRLSGGALTGLLLCWGCQGTTVRPAGETIQKTKAEPPPSEKHTTELEAPPGERISFQEQLNHVADLRKLKVQGEVSGLSVKAADLVFHVERSLELQTPPEALSGTEKLLVGLGVVPIDFDFRATMLELLGENLQGLYDPRLKMMLVRDEQTTQRNVTLAHELVHALQDQHFDLDEIVEFNDDDTDRSSALSCLAEGDATSTMFDAVLPDGQTALDLPAGFIRQQFSSMESGTEKKAPDLIVRSLTAPYLDGVEFVHILRRRGGFEEVNRVWEKPPISTEQVLHIEKYDSFELPIEVPMPRAPNDTWKLSFHDTWGEQSLRLLFSEWLPAPRAAEAAAGWGGDRIALYEKQDSQVLHWHIVADSEKDAREMFEAFSFGFKKEERGSTKSRCGQPSSRDPRLLALEISGKDLHVLSPSLRRSDAVLGSCAEAQGWLSTWVGKSDPEQR